MLMVGLTFAVIVCAGSNASGFLWEQSSLLFRSNSIRCPNRFQFKIVPCEIKWKIRDERLSYESLASCFISVIISVAASYTLGKLTRRESKKIPMRKKFLFLFYYEPDCKTNISPRYQNFRCPVFHFKSCITN